MLILVASSSPSPYPGVQQQVVRLDVSVDEAQLVDGVDGQHGLRYVELGGLLCQGVLLHQQRHHVACVKRHKDGVENRDGCYVAKALP